ncbi:MAG: LysR family transcriptional regulator [Mangrovicoccus sp.]
MPRPYDLPSLGDLACFEAAARCLSFKQAAQELNVTPAAVSHRIKALESDLQQPLFTRHYRGVELTEAGTLLFVAIQRGFETISGCVERVRFWHDQDSVTIKATTAMSSLWLTPRLAAFWQSYPGIAISQIAQENTSSPGLNPSSDLSICYGDPEAESDETHILIQDQILALGTPEFKESYQIHKLEDLLDAPLIHTRTAEQDWTEWESWFQLLGQPAPRGRSFLLNNYLISLGAAENSIGAVLGWEGLAHSYVDTGRLVQIVPETVPSPYPFYLRIHSHASANARLFAQWLLDEGSDA